MYRIFHGHELPRVKILWRVPFGPTRYHKVATRVMATIEKMGCHGYWNDTTSVLKASFRYTVQDASQSMACFQGQLAGIFIAVLH